jgi:hypothetical protein
MLNVTAISIVIASVDTVLLTHMHYINSPIPDASIIVVVNIAERINVKRTIKPDTRKKFENSDGPEKRCQATTWRARTRGIRNLCTADIVATVRPECLGAGPFKKVHSAKVHSAFESWRGLGMTPP